MNYYKRHLGDYAKDTRHLSLAEHGAYCLLLDYYYSTETPLPADRCERIANAYAEHEREAVQNVLKAFFTQTPEGWRNSRADAEIAEFHAKSLKAKSAAEARWSGRNADAYANASETHAVPQSERNASHKPLAIREKKEQDAPDGATPPAPKKSKGGVTLTTYLANCEAEGAEAIPAEDAVFTYAEQVGLPREFLALAWRWFKGKYGPDGSGKAKRYTDWRAVFRNAVRDCWPKYWAIDQSGAYYLTTQGKQAQREFSDAG